MTTLPALSIRAPWAWLVCAGFKDIENRSWPTPFRGKFIVHSGKNSSLREYNEVAAFAAERKIVLPAFDQLQRGGFVGVAEVTDCVTDSNSPWFFGEHGFVLANAKALPFVQFNGRLGFFNVQTSLLHESYL